MSVTDQDDQHGGRPGLGIQIQHIGNVANNAFHNRRLIALESRRLGDVIDQQLLVSDELHALSAPAWELLDFETPSTSFVNAPQWSNVEGATALHSANWAATSDSDCRSSLVDLLRNSFKRGLLVPLRPFAVRVLTVWRERQGRRDAQISGLFNAERENDQSEREVRIGSPRELSVGARRAKHGVDVQVGANYDFRIYYGVPSMDLTVAAAAVDAHRAILLEHGTLRWIGHGPDRDWPRRDAYAYLVRRARHLWVTNLDDSTIEIAEELAPNRWSALPHPYVLDSRAPYDFDPQIRERLSRAGRLERLILMPSSINWAADHNKGTMAAIEAFEALATESSSVGLVLVRWGRDIAALQEILRRMGIQDQITWVDPQPRIGLQRMIAAVDVVWDQFHLEAFGGLAIKAMEQAAPLVTRGVSPASVYLMGSVPPWLPASSPEEIVTHTQQVLYSDDGSYGRSVGDQGRDWLLKVHSHSVTYRLQAKLFNSLRCDEGPGSLLPDEWARAVRGSKGGAANGS